MIKGVLSQVIIFLLLVLFIALLPSERFATTYGHLPCKTMRFIDSRTGWIAGDDGLYRTQNAGLTWVPLNEGFPTPADTQYQPYRLNDAFFINAHVGWVVSAYGKILKTTNGGLSWIDQTSNALKAVSNGRAESKFYRLRFVNDRVGWILGYTYDGMKSQKGSPYESTFLLRTPDGGVSWDRTDIKHLSAFPNIQFLDELNGWLFEPKMILKTYDGGYSWVPQIISNNSSINDLIFIDSKNGWAVDEHGKVFHTNDGGSSWLRKHFGNYLLKRVYFSDLKNGWIVGLLKKKSGSFESILFGTKDGGKSWKVQYRELYKTLIPFFINSQEGWLLVNDNLVSHEANEYKLFYTSDGGDNWNPLF